MSPMSDTSVARWSALGDLVGDTHTRDILATEARRERARSSTQFTQSDGLHPMGKGWAVYNAAIYPVRDIYGREHMLTLKRYKVYVAVLGMLARDEWNTSMTVLANGLGVAVQTVSNTLRRLMAWGIIGYLSSRGRYGGITMFRRDKGDGLDRFMAEAKAWLKAKWEAKVERFRAHSNFHTGVKTVDRGTRTSLLSSSVEIRIERDNRIEAHFMGIQRGAQKRVPCPAHGGEDRNLSFWRRQDGSLGVKCWSHQCAERDVKDAVEPWPPMFV